MSGAHSQHRTPNRPLIIGGIAIPKVDKNGNPAMRWVSKPTGTYENGRCVEWTHTQEFVTRHVLDYRPAPVVVSKHAAGRTRKLDDRNKARLVRMRQRAAQAAKTLSEDRRAMIEHLAG